jgi:hypothetical protein
MMIGGCPDDEIDFAMLIKSLELQIIDFLE